MIERWRSTPNLFSRRIIWHKYWLVFCPTAGVALFSKIRHEPRNYSAKFLRVIRTMRERTWVSGSSVEFRTGWRTRGSSWKRGLRSPQITQSQFEIWINLDTDGKAGGG